LKKISSFGFHDAFSKTCAFVAVPVCARTGALFIPVAVHGKLFQKPMLP
jgi:hypothetical protein